MRDYIIHASRCGRKGVTVTSVFAWSKNLHHLAENGIFPHDSRLLSPG